MSDFMPFCKALPEVLVEGYAGIGGMAEGAKRLGIPTALAMDSWEPALAVHAINHPDTHHHDKVRFGHGSKGSIEEVAHRIEEAVDGQTYHLHGSPPCPLFTSANPLSDPKAGMEQEGGAGWWFKLIDRLKQGRNPPLSDSTENAPEMRPAILRDPSLPAYLHEAAAMPLLSGAEFGAPQTRSRTVLGEGWEAQPTHSKDNFLSIEDVLPHLRGEWEDNLPSIQEKVAGLAENNQIGLRGSKMFSEPTLSFGGAINPGSGGAKWNRLNDLEGTPGFSFGHTTPITNPAHGITHHRPALTHTRTLTVPEVLQLHGFPDDYDLSPGKGSHRLNTPARTRRPNIDTMLGNVLLPGVAEGVLRGHFGKSDEVV
jgi:site-specific DNA-cytosine methylase